MGQTIKATFVCDNCEVTIITDGDRPDGWSGHIPRAQDSLASGTLITYDVGFFSEPTYCGDCIRAASDAVTEALARRKALAGFSRGSSR